MRNESFVERMRRDGIWDLLEEYMDIRDALEETLDSFTDLQDDIGIAMEDIGGQLESLQEQLTRTSNRLKRFKTPAPIPVRRHEVVKVQEDCELPFDD